MGVHRLRYTPLGESTETSIDLETDLGLSRFAGGRRSDALAHATAGGNVLTSTRDVWFEYEISLLGISSTANAGVWRALFAFVAHALAGARFAFELDSAKVYDSTLSVAATRGDTTVDPVASTSSVAVGDAVVLEHLDDPRRTEVCIATSHPSGVINLAAGLEWSYPVGSIVRHYGYLPACCLVPPFANALRYVQRDASDGLDTWDLELRFRTVR